MEDLGSISAPGRGFIWASMTEVSLDEIGMLSVPSSPLISSVYTVYTQVDLYSI